MNAQPASIGHQFISATADNMEEIINKLQQLGAGTGVGANYYKGTNEIKIRFGDYDHGIQFVELTPQNMAAVRAYMDQRDEPSDQKIRALFNDADSALIRAMDYVREQHGHPAAKSVVRPA